MNHSSSLRKGSKHRAKAFKPRPKDSGIERWEFRVENWQAADWLQKFLAGALISKPPPYSDMAIIPGRVVIAILKRWSMNGQLLPHGLTAERLA